MQLKNALINDAVQACNIQAYLLFLEAVEFSWLVPA